MSLETYFADILSILLPYILITGHALLIFIQMGTVIEPASEFFSGRLTKRERKTTLADELLSDLTLKAYR